MKKIYTIALLFVATIAFSQSGAPAAPYYNGFNWSQTGTTLKNALATKITTTHTRKISYDNVWDASQATDLDPTDGTNTNVLLLYGFSNNICPASTADGDDHRRRNKNSTGGGNSCQWNREHTYAKSLGTPALVDGGSGSTSDAGEDAHHIRPSDVDRNGDRGSKKFAAGSGNSGNVSGGWYPGDEWKGDVARMMMYMYLRYPTQCLPKNVGTGTAVSTDTNMLNLFLQWNAEDPVSAYEDRRNTYHGNTSNSYAQGNRNPFIDNPYLATVIWGGPVAENRWPNVFLSTEDFTFAAVSIYPNPSNNHKINIETEEVLDEIQLVNMNGQLMQQIKNPNAQNNTYSLENLPSGFYFLKLSSENQSTVKKVIIN